MQRPLSEGRGARGLGSSGPGLTPQVLRLGWCTPEPGRPSPSRSVSFEAENRPRRCTGRPGEAWGASGDTLLPAALAPPRVPAEPPTPSRVPGLAGSSGPRVQRKPPQPWSLDPRVDAALSSQDTARPPAWPRASWRPSAGSPDSDPVSPVPGGGRAHSLGPSRRPGPEDEDAAAALREPPRPRAARGPKPAREDGGEGSLPGSVRGRRRPAAPRSPRSPPPPAACPGHTDTRLSLAGRSPGRTEDRQRTPPSPCRGGLGALQLPGRGGGCTWRSPRAPHPGPARQPAPAPGHQPLFVHHVHHPREVGSVLRWAARSQRGVPPLFPSTEPWGAGGAEATELPRGLGQLGPPHPPTAPTPATPDRCGDD
ncbi:uncharacterized protein AAEQ78_001531 [Lycaon pictus]